MTRITTEEEAFQALLEGTGDDAPEDLQALVAFARALPRVEDTPSDAFKAGLRRRLISEAGAAPASPLQRLAAAVARRNASWRRSFRVTTAMGVAAVSLLAGGAVFAAAERSLPGDALYGAKRLREGVRQTLTRGTEAKGRAHLASARTRLAELTGLADRGVADADPYRRTINDMDASTLTGTELLVTTFRDTQERDVLVDLGSFASQQQADLENLVDRLPADARPMARDSIALVAKVRERSQDILRGCPCPSNPQVPKTDAPDRQAPAAQVDEGCVCRPSRSPGLGPAPDADPPTDSGGEKPPTGTTDPADEEPDPEDPDRVPDTGVGPLDEAVDRLIDDLLAPAAGPSAAPPSITPPPLP